jgi:hypothetical protein
MSKYALGGWAGLGASKMLEWVNGPGRSAREERVKFLLTLI